jgi:hypothetical protein
VHDLGDLLHGFTGLGEHGTSSGMLLECGPA